MKKLTQLITLLSLLLLVLPMAQAQQQPAGRALTILPSPRGNHVLLFPFQSGAADSVVLQQTDYFLVERVEITDRLLKREQAKFDKAGADTASVDPIKTREVARIRRLTTIADMRRVVSADFLTALKEWAKVTTDEQLLRYVQTHSNLESYGPLAISMELRLLLGHLFVDFDVKAGSVYYYRTYRVDAARQQTRWAEGLTLAGAPNQSLRQLRVRGARVQGQDSLVAMTWTLPIRQFETLSQPPAVTRNDFSDATFRQSLAIHRTSSATLRGTVMVYNGTDWKADHTLTPSVNATGDSLVFYWQKRCLPETVVRAYLLPLDEVDNTGTPSDTLTGAAVTNARLFFIYSAKAKDTTNAVRISWPRLPAKPYYMGIEVQRDNGADSTFTVLGRVTPQDSVWLDYSVRPGINYTYRVRPVFYPLQGLQQAVPAEAVGSCTKFSKPLPVTDVQVSHEGPNVRLNWTGTSSPSLYGYFVYRGTSKTNLSLVSDGIRYPLTTYLDTAGVLSARTEYFYSVLAMNLTQDTSTLAPPVGIRPHRPIDSTYPKLIEATVVNKTAWLSWNDVRQQDNILTAFVLQRSRTPAGPYRPISTSALAEPSYVDTSVRAGQPVWYRVAALTAFGDTTAFSEATRVLLPLPDPAPVFSFNVRNTTPGIEVSWPGTTDGRCQKYGIYRREATTDSYSKIGEMPKGNTRFVDTQVRAGSKYVYSITSIETDNRESRPVTGKAIVRN